jgi:hypothetical protein
MVVSCVSKGMELLLEWNGAHYTPGNRLRQVKTWLKSVACVADYRRLFATQSILTTRSPSL